jgi:DNA-binding NtrC family response regulator
MSDVLKRELERLLIGSSRLMQLLRAEIVRLGPSKLPVLIQGPTGSGKELVARGLHLASGRAGPFVAFNVCAVPDSMFEDALFGHVKGAFTGANSDSLGYLAEAHGGTVLLDEINGLSLAAQAKLLRAIETGVFRPVGARRDRHSDFRLLAAANSRLSETVAVGQFRADLYFRLAGLTVDVPSLRERTTDIPELVQHFAVTDGQAHSSLPPTVPQELLRYDWPGNVRELRHVVARAWMQADEHLATPSLIVSPLDAALQSSRSIRVTDKRSELLALLRELSWDAGRVAERIGVHRATVYRRIIRFGLSEPPSCVTTDGKSQRTPN